MKKNEVGRVLKVVGVLAIILGSIGSIIMGFSTVQSSMDEMFGIAGPQTITFSFSQAIPGIFFSIVAGAILIGLAEIIYILDEHKENARRLCRRFGIMPVEYDDYAQAREAINNRRRAATQHPHGGQYAQAQPQAPLHQAQQAAQIHKDEQQQRPQEDKTYGEKHNSQEVEDYGDE